MKPGHKKSVRSLNISESLLAELIYYGSATVLTALSYREVEAEPASEGKPGWNFHPGTPVIKIL